MKIKLIYFVVVFILIAAKVIAQEKENYISKKLIPYKNIENMYEIHKLEFVGNKFLSNGYLQDIISSQKSNRSLQHLIYQYYYENLKKIPETPDLLVEQFRLGVNSLKHEIIFFNKSLADADVKIINEGLNANGFHSSDVYYTFIQDTNKKINILTYYIEENAQYKIDTIVYIGLDSLDDETNNLIKNINRIAKNTYFNEIDIQKEANQIQNILLNNGYFYSKYEIEPIIINTKNITDSITIRFKVGRRQKIANISFVDSLRGQNYIVVSLKEKLMDLKVGDWFSNLKLQNSINNFYSLGLFEYVTIDTSSVIVPITDSTLSYLVTTKYRKQKEWGIGLFVNNTQIDNFVNIGLEASISHKNWGGAAQYGMLFSNAKIKNISRVFEGQGSEWEGQIGIRFSQPLIWSLSNFKIGGSSSFYYSYSNVFQLFNISAWYLPIRFPITLTNSTFINQIIIDFNFEFQNPINYIDVVNSLNQDTNVVIGRDDIRILQALNLYNNLHNFLHSNETKILTSNIFGLSLIGDTRNHPFSPTSGYYFYASIDGWNWLFSLSYIKPIETYFSGIAKFLRYQLLYSLFQEVDKGLVLGFKIKGGLINLLDKESSFIPFERQFFAGGANSIRGWLSRELHYSKIESSTDTLDQQYYQYEPEAYTLLSNILGNRKIFEGSIELRYTFSNTYNSDNIFIDQLSKIGLVAFFDFGNAYNWLAERETNITNIRWFEFFTKSAAATGLGLRYDTPIGPLRFDVAIPIYRPNVYSNDFKIWEVENMLKEIRFHFGIGHAF